MRNADEQDPVFCLDAKTGKEVWKHSYPPELGIKLFDGGTTGTPTVDDAGSTELRGRTYRAPWQYPLV